jgi:CubicO group peptidase (beta-lactamase class C family)
METTSLSLAAGLDRALENSLSERRLVGGYVAVSREGTLEYEQAVGLADRESNTLFQPDTIVRLSSVTKPFVSAVALRLIDEGRLGLDDPVTKWLPDFRPTLPDGEQAMILVRHLLTHTSGLSYRLGQPAGGPYEVAGISDGLDMPGRSLEDNLARIAALPLDFEPGTNWEYSVGTDVLGALLQEVTGDALPAVVSRLVTNPLGMRDSAFVVKDQARLATPYVNDSPEPHLLADGETVTNTYMPDAAGVTFAPSRVFDPTSFPSGGGGMAGTGSEVHLLLEAIRLDAADGQQRLLRQETARSLFQGQIGALDTYPGMTFGFAGAVVRDPILAGTPQPAGTLNWGGVYGHSWFVDPVNAITATIVTNTIYEGTNGQLTIDVRDVIYAAAE